MKKKHFIIFSAYACAIIVGLGIFSLVSQRRLSAYRAASMHSSQLALEETVRAVRSMSNGLEKSLYATDRGMCMRLASQVYADALAAEAAMSTLPFTTHELEQLSGYVNQVGDYAHSICAGGESFDDGQRETLAKLSPLASSLAESLDGLERSVHEGSILIDRREERGSTGMSESGMISGEFERLEAEFPTYDLPEYDGIYGAETRKSSSSEQRKLSDAELLAMAAGILGASPGEMSLEYEYEDGGGRKCYRRGDTLVCVGPGGVESMSQSRLVDAATISLDEAISIGEAFIEKQGYKDMRLIKSEESGGLARLSFATEKNGVLYPENRINLAVAMDDASLYSMSAVDYSAKLPQLEWKLSAQQAAESLPEQLKAGEGQKLAVSSSAGKPTACYVFDCVAEDGLEIRIYVNAQNGKQQEIEILRT